MRDIVREDDLATVLILGADDIKIPTDAGGRLANLRDYLVQQIRLDQTWSLVQLDAERIHTLMDGIYPASPKDWVCVELLVLVADDTPKTLPPKLVVWSDTVSGDYTTFAVGMRPRVDDANNSRYRVVQIFSSARCHGGIDQQKQDLTHFAIWYKKNELTRR